MTDIEGSEGTSPASFVHIEPVVGDIVEIWFETVDSMLYGLVREIGDGKQWTICYVARTFGYELLWSFQAVGKEKFVEILGVEMEGVVEVAVDEEHHTLMVMQDVDELRVVMMFHFNEPLDE
jgi:hypothetical protein